jgi:hypothetical protein
MSNRNNQTAEVVEFVPAKRSRTDTQFKPGQSGNPKGRPKSSKHKLNDEFLYELSESWAEGGREVLRRVMQEQPVEYLKMMTKLIIAWDIDDTPEQPSLEALSDEDLALLGQFLRWKIELAERAERDL